MRILLDWLIDQAEQMEIPIPMARKEAERLLDQWGKRRVNDEPAQSNPGLSGSARKYYPYGSFQQSGNHEAVNPDI
jgi:hypothetical protein